MIIVEFQPEEHLPAAHYRGLQKEVDYLRRVIARLVADVGGYAGTAANNGQVVESIPASPTEVFVLGPATLMVPLAAGSGSVPFYKSATESLLVPALNTIAGQSRQDLVCAKVNVGQENTYTYAVVQGTPATTGAQVDPAVPDNHYALARITRAHGAGAIVNAMITDLRTRLTATP